MQLLSHSQAAEGLYATTLSLTSRGARSSELTIVTVTVTVTVTSLSLHTPHLRFVVTYSRILSVIVKIVDGLNAM